MNALRFDGDLADTSSSAIVGSLSAAVCACVGGVTAADSVPIGNVANGEQLFAKQCQNCHRVAGKGGRVGRPGTTARERHESGGSELVQLRRALPLGGGNAATTTGRADDDAASFAPVHAIADRSRFKTDDLGRPEAVIVDPVRAVEQALRLVLEAHAGVDHAVKELGKTARDSAVVGDRRV